MHGGAHLSVPGLHTTSLCTQQPSHISLMGSCCGWAAVYTGCKHNHSLGWLGWELSCILILCLSLPTCSLSLSLSAVPVITTEEEEVTVVYTNPLHLSCNATGIKEPTYK